MWAGLLALAFASDGWTVAWLAAHRSPGATDLAGFLRWWGQSHFEAYMALGALVISVARRGRAALLIAAAFALIWGWAVWQLAASRFDVYFVVAALIIGLAIPRGKAVLVGAAGVSAWALTTGLVQALKHLIGRARPWQADGLPFVFHGPSDGFESFPSGDAAKAFCIAYVVQRLLPAAGWPLYVLAGLVAYQRVYLWRHFPSDIVMAAGVGIMAARISVALCQRYVGRQERPRQVANDARGEPATSRMISAEATQE